MAVAVAVEVAVDVDVLDAEAVGVWVWVDVAVVVSVAVVVDVAVGEPADDVENLVERFEVLCRLSSSRNGDALILSVSLDKDDAWLESLVPIYAGAAWHERETSEMFVTQEELLEEAYRIARRIARHSPVAIALTRQMMYRNAARPHPLDAHKVDSLAMFYTSVGSGKEGVQSFLEKREARFTDSAARDMPPFYPWWE